MLITLRARSILGQGPEDYTVEFSSDDRDARLFLGERRAPPDKLRDRQRYLRTQDSVKLVRKGKVPGGDSLWRVCMSKQPKSSFWRKFCKSCKLKSQ